VHVRSVALLLASLAAIGIAVQQFGYGTAPRSTVAARTAPSAAQTQAERSLTLLDVWAQAIVPSMLLEHSRAQAVGAGEEHLAARLARRLRGQLLRAASFEADLAHDPGLRTSDSIDALVLHDAAAAWRAWASALLRLPAGRSRRTWARIAALEARAVRLHQTAYAVVDASFRTALTGR
jgi:hypothetical protein